MQHFHIVLAILASRHSYETADGSYREEKATIINPGTENEMISVVGKYRYKNENGEVVEVSYTSDDHGFVPTGTIIHKEVMKNARIVSQQIDDEGDADVKYGGRKRKPEWEPMCRMEMLDSTEPNTALN